RKREEFWQAVTTNRPVSCSYRFSLEGRPAHVAQERPLVQFRNAMIDDIRRAPGSRSERRTCHGTYARVVGERKGTTGDLAAEVGSSQFAPQWPPSHLMVRSGQSQLDFAADQSHFPAKLFTL